MNQTEQAPARFDIYRLIHKGIRGMMAETLLAVGRADWRDEAEAALTLASVGELIDFCADHIEHENTFVHAAMERGMPGSTARIADEHRDHDAAIAALRADLDAVARAPLATRSVFADALYDRLARFVGENFEHMHYEETHNNGVLWSAYDDAQIIAIHDALLASLSPQQHMQSLRWMVPQAAHAERVMLLGGMRAAAPPPAFEAAMAMLKPLLSAADWAKLGAALDDQVLHDQARQNQTLATAA